MTKVILKIPEFSLIMLVGASGCGKSSFARRHFKPTEIISSDYCRSLVADDENDQSVTKEAFEILHFIASKRLTAGKLAVIDATNVQSEARKSLIDLARQHHVIPVAIILNISPEICQKRNEQRTDRKLGKHAVRHQSDQLKRSLKTFRREGINHVHILNSVEEIDNVILEQIPLWNNLKHEKGPFDIIGDIHGCFDELYKLLLKLGYQIIKEDSRYVVRHPEGRKVIFVGDLVDRGPKTPEVIRIVMDMVNTGIAFCVTGNHDDKLKRKLQGRDVKIAHGLAESLAQLELESKEFKEEALKFLDKLISHYVFDDGKLAVAHAGLKEEFIGRGSARIRDFCMYGETNGEIDEFGLPVRYSWASDYRGKSLIVYGHTPVPEVEWLNNTINIDTGCVFGGKLTALRYPEKEIISQDAEQTYCIPVKPLNKEMDKDDILDIKDVLGKRIIRTHLNTAVIIPEENASKALEMISRFSIDPRWLIYLPPTMSPSETSKDKNLLEHPSEAFSYYRNHGVGQVICEEKHMGSRAVIVVCKDKDAARKYFNVSGEVTGVCYTRTGRSFFTSPDLEQEFISRVTQAITKAGLWDELKTDWFCIDGEIMPWSAKARNLLENQYAPVGAAASTVLPEAASLLATIMDKVDGGQALYQKFKSRSDMAFLYCDAYRRYCWPVEKIEDYKLAPFHILAYEGNQNLDKDHLWHLNIIERLCDVDSTIFQKTAYKVVNTKDPLSCNEAIDWWSDMTLRGGEGMVVKPLNFTVHGNKGLIQPGIKCRGREYLRIIYGPEYTSPENLERLRSRGLSRKRSIAVREYALGYEALRCFINKEPFYRVHECVFGILALESEPMDPRL